MEQKNNHAIVKINPFVVYIGLAIIAVVMQTLIPFSFIPTNIARMLGAILILLNFVFGLPALIGMAKAKTSPNPNHPSNALVSRGIYKLTRNPMYIGLTLFFAGILTFFQNDWGLVFTPLLLWLITLWVIIPEERYLTDKFGEGYTQYTRIVRRWI